MTTYVNDVNPLQGTDSRYTYSRGNTLPLITRPFGMAAWCPQTDEAGGRWFFHPSHRQLQGLRLTHQPSPWIGDYGHLTLMPQSGPCYAAPSARASSFALDQTEYRPHYYRTYLNRYRIGMEIAPTERCASLQFKFEQRDEEARLLVSFFGGDYALNIDEDRRLVSGYTKSSTGGAPEGFAMYFVLSFDCELDEVRSGIEELPHAEGHSPSSERESAVACITVRLPENGVVGLRMGTSFISIQQAQLNLEVEIGSRCFDDSLQEAEEAWERRLSVIEVEGGTEAQRKTFYSCLYRLHLFPRIWHEYDHTGSALHYSPHDGTVHPGTMYADIGFWDVYRTSFPLYALLFPELLGEMLQSWVNVYKESGWMPKWLSPGERGTMPGTLIDAIIADGYVKGIRGFDVETAYEGLRKHAMTTADLPRVGRHGMEHYGAEGYLPSDLYGESVSHTLDYAYGDYCIAQLAKGLGYEEDFVLFSERGRNYKNLFDSSTGFIRGKRADGSWHEPFDPITWGDPYCEGGPWQCSWAVPHDIEGLAELMGGKKAFEERLDELMTSKPHFKVGTYGSEIHEMSEMADAELGQWAISNQPGFSIPYLYSAIGRREKTAYWVKEAMDRLFSSEARGFPGDEDNGSMAAWYIWGCMGLYPLCPGTPEYVLGAKPLFAKMTIRLTNGQALVIEPSQEKQGESTAVRVNGTLWHGNTIHHSQLAAGARLDL